MKKNGAVEKTVTERSVVNINGTLYVSIPKAFADRHSIRPGDRLPMILGDSQLKIIPHEK
jgi:hypothetical protein